jgi:hypothetical protein
MSDYKIPFKTIDGQKRMLEYPGGWNANPIDWEDNREFDDRLKYLGYSTGRSAIRFRFQSLTDGTQYSMGIAAMDDIVRRLKDGEVTGVWTFKKQGSNYGLIPVPAK